MAETRTAPGCAAVLLASGDGASRDRAEMLEYLATFDEITWLARRHHFEDELARADSSSGRHHRPLGLVVTAADDWDRVRRLPQDAQRAVLREIAVLIGSIQGTEDLAARWDDARFAVLLPAVGAEGARAFAERLLAAVAAAPIPVGTGSIAVTMSAGYVAYPDGEADLGRLIASAEAALAEAQARGGNQVVSA